MSEEQDDVDIITDMMDDYSMTPENTIQELLDAIENETSTDDGEV